MDISYIRTIQQAKNSQSKIETKIEYNKRRLEKAYFKNLENLYLIDAYTNEEKVISVHKQKHEDWGRYLQSTALLRYNLHNGDTFYHEERNEYYQVQNMEENNHFYDFDLVACNYILKWQDSDRVIREFPCVVISASQYNSGEKATKTLTLGYNQLMMRIMCNEHTIKFKSDRRFFIDNEKTSPKVYRITRADSVNAPNGVGFMEVVLTEDVFNAETDSIDEFVCDYQKEADHDIVVSFKGSPEIRIGQTKTFESNKAVTWTTDASFITLSVVDDTHVKAKCENNPSLVGDSFHIYANTVSTEIKVVGIL